MNTFTRRQVLGQVAVTAAGFGGAAPRKPNLVFVLADQLRYHSCGYAGDQTARTPNIDRLAGAGLNLRNAVSSTPVCSAYRSSLMTGKYTTSTGMVINELRLSPEHEFFGQALARGGYQTALIGKWHMWANQQGGHDKPVNGFVPPGPYRFGFDGYWAGYNFNHTYFGAPYFRDTAERFVHEGYEPDSQATMAIDFIRRAKAASEPFAVFLLWGPPHNPWGADNVPPEYAARFRGVNIPRRPNYSEKPDTYADGWGTIDDRYPSQMPDWQRIYYAQTANLDWNLGRLMSALDQQGLAKDTIVVFTSDHGEMWGSHGRRGKNTFYEEATRVPFLIRWPGHVSAGSVSDACLGTPDIMPTLLGMMGLPAPKTVEGIDFSRHVLGRGGAEPAAAYLQGTGTTAAWLDGHEWRALRDRHYTYARYRRDGRELLFDNVADPYQMKDLAGERAHSARLTHFRDQLGKWMKLRNDTFESCTWYRDHWTVNRNVVRTATGVTQDLDALDKLLRDQTNSPKPG